MCVMTERVVREKIDDGGLKVTVICRNDAAMKEPQAPS
jgi:hypothetical protein